MIRFPRSRSRTAAWALPGGLIVICSALATLASLDDRWHRRFDYLRSDIADGDAWRLVTGHLMHWSAGHAVLDIAALALVAWIFIDALSPRAQCGVAAATVGTIDAALWWLHPEVERYVGLSGLLHGWFAAGAVYWCLAPSTASGDGRSSSVARAWGVALLIGLLAKLAIEAGGGAFWLDSAAFPVVTASHRWGAVGGATAAAVVALVRRRRGAAPTGASRTR